MTDPEMQRPLWRKPDRADLWALLICGGILVAVVVLVVLSEATA